MWILFADTDWGVLIGAVLGVGGISGVIGAIAGWYMKLRRESSTDRARREKTTRNELQDIIDQERQGRQADKADCERRAGLLETRIANLESRQWRMYSFYNTEFARSIMLYDLLVLTVDIVERQNAALSGANLPTQKAPRLPDRPMADSKVEAEFMMNQSRQESSALAVAKPLADPGTTS